MEDNLISLGRNDVTCIVHPVVVLNILDHHSRRNKGQTRVIGTLLGINNDGLIDITNCFPVPHKEVDSEEKVGIDMEYHRTMLNFHYQANPSEIIVGWYSSTGEINSNSKYINEFYGNEIQRPPIHLCVDVDLKTESISLKAFMATSVSFEKQVVAAHFNRISLKLDFTDTERIAMTAINANKELNPPIAEDGEEKEEEDSELERQVGVIHHSIERLEEIVGDLQTYLADVCSGKKQPNKIVGRKLQKIISQLNIYKPESFRNMFNDGIQDLLLVAHLANITQAQLQAAEKIHQIL